MISNNKFRKWLINSTYKTPFINFIFSTKDFIEPKFVNYEEYRLNQNQLNKRFILEEILNKNIHIVTLMDKKNKIKYNLLDVARSFDLIFKKNSKRYKNLLIIVDETKDYFEIIFINTSEIYEESSYIKKHYNKKDTYYKNNMNNLSFLFVYYSLGTNGISVISKNKIDFLKNQNVYYLSKKEQKNIFNKLIPIEKVSTKIFRIIIIILLFLLPFSFLNYYYFNNRLNKIELYKQENNNLNNMNNKIQNDIQKLKNKYKKLLNVIKDQRKYKGFNK